MARYTDAIFWVVTNDDTEFLDDAPDSALSVAASMVADLFGKTDMQVRADLVKERKRQGREVKESE